MTPQQLLDSGKRRLQVADLFMSQTYPAVQEPRLFVNALQGLLAAMEDTISAVLIIERNAGHLAQYHESFVGKLEAAKSAHIQKKYGLSAVDTHMLAEMHEIVEEHKKAATIFPRKGALVVANDDFSLQTLSLEKLKTYLERCKSLYIKIHDSLTRNPELLA